MKGFTLIELLVVVAIIGILAAIAIPQFSEYRSRSFDSMSLSDLKNAVTAQEAVYVDTNNYAECSDAGCNAELPGFRKSDDVEIEVIARNNFQDFSITSLHPSGNLEYEYDSETGLITSNPQ